MLILKSGNPLKRKVECLVVPVCENKKIHENTEILELIKESVKLKEFSGKESEELIIYDKEGVSAKRIIFAGMGKAGSVSDETLRVLSGKVLKKCIEMKVKNVSFVVPVAQKLNTNFKDIAVSLFEGATLANYIFDQYIGEKTVEKVEKIELIADAKEIKKYSGLSEQVENICNGTLLARDLVTTPSNDKTPEKFVELIKKFLTKSKVKLTVLSEKELAKLGFGSLLSVAEGSSRPPCMAIADYNPKNAKKTIALVGKGVTFDSGGINLKPSSGLAEMKTDMAGAAVVAATLKAMGELQPDVRIIGVMPLVENMPSGSALRPGDIVKAYNGKTIEIGNTDAEGRLILADALSYTEKIYKPDIIIDIATLTGACVVALGEKIAGVFSLNDKLAGRIVQSGKNTGERCWQMPMPDDYKKLLKSECADIANVSRARWGGSITAALFLSEFVKNKKWAHIDIAGPTFSLKPGDYCPSGGTGFGVRLLCDFINNL